MRAETRQTTNDPLSELYLLLDAAGLRPHRDGNSIYSECPRHRDLRPNLRIWVGEDRTLGTYCSAGCSTDETELILAELRATHNGQVRVTAATVAADDVPDAGGSDVVECTEPIPLAEHFIEQLYHDDGGQPLLRRWRGEFYRFTGSCYRPLTDEQLDAQLYRHLDKLWTPKGTKEKAKLVKVNPNSHQVREVRLALPSRDLLIEDNQAAPFWLDDHTEPLPAYLIPCGNGLLDLATCELHASTPAFFCTHALPFSFDPDSEPPQGWLKFLDQLFPDDPGSIATLREWFAYVLSADTRQHKAMLLVGPKRAGKGTIGRVLTGLLGAENVAGPPLAALASNFGLQSLLGQPLAIISDARLSGRTDQAIVVERLLRITGEDALDIDRKHKAPLTVVLPTRLMLLTNELPRLADSSGALAGRFIVLMLRESWYGREDHELTDRLLGELPAILTWALGGWETLQTRGHFVQPETSADAIQELEDLGSPVGAFVGECCVLRPHGSVDCAELFNAWRTWCTDNGRDHPGTVQSFGRDLRAVHPHIGRGQRRDVVGDRKRFYKGICLD